MSVLLWLLLLFVVSLVVYREYWYRRDLPKEHCADFEGYLFIVGKTFIARRPANNENNRAIVCFPGFLEDMRYFLDLYEGTNAELILLNNANYHCPFPEGDAVALDWPPNPFELGSIEHDAFYLGLTLKHLVSAEEVCLHGHSRGAAVVLEAGRQYPELMKSKERLVSAILEAPVLPQARTPGNTHKPLQHLIACYFMPLFFGLSRNVSEERLLQMSFMRGPRNELKTRLCRSIFSVARNYATCVANVRSIVRWQRQMPFSTYKNFRSLTVVIGERDDSLDKKSMEASAMYGERLNPGLKIVRTANTNHFISLEQPDSIRAIHGNIFHTSMGRA